MASSSQMQIMRGLDKYPSLLRPGARSFKRRLQGSCRTKADSSTHQCGRGSNNHRENFRRNLFLLAKSFPDQTGRRGLGRDRGYLYRGSGKQNNPSIECLECGVQRVDALLHFILLPEDSPAQSPLREKETRRAASGDQQSDDRKIDQIEFHAHFLVVASLIMIVTGESIHASLPDGVPAWHAMLPEPGRDTSLSLRDQ